MAQTSYEAIYIVPASYEDEQVEQVVERFKKVVTDNGGEVEHAAKWEKRRMTFEIAGQREGIYCLMLFSSDHTLPAELTRVFRISDDILRARIYKKDD